MSDVTFIPDFEYQNVGTNEIPNIKLAQASNAGTTTLYFTRGILDETGAQITKAVVLSIQSGGLVLNCYVPAGELSADGKTATNVVRGLKRGGLDFTTQDADEDFDLEAGATVAYEVDAKIVNMFAQALLGNIASGGASWSIGKDTDENITVFAANGDANKPFWRYDSATNQWVFSNDGVSSSPFGTGAGVTGGDGITVTAGDIDVDLTDTVIFKTARTGNESRATVTAAADGKLDKTFMPSMLEDLIDSGTTAAEIDQVCDGVSANVTAANLGTLTAGAGTPIVTLHSHKSATGSGSKSVAATSDTITIAHGLGAAPNWIKIVSNCQFASGGGLSSSNGRYIGSTYATLYSSSDNTATITLGNKTDRIIYLDFNDGSARIIQATVSVDGTNITISLTNSSASAKTIYYCWECGI